MKVKAKSVHECAKVAGYISAEGGSKRKLAIQVSAAPDALVDGCASFHTALGIEGANLLPSHGRKCARASVGECGTMT